MMVDGRHSVGAVPPSVHGHFVDALFRWFKFTLKPPYSITLWQITIGHLGHFLLDFLVQIWTQGTLRHIVGPILVILEICHFWKYVPRLNHGPICCPIQNT